MKKFAMVLAFLVSVATFAQAPKPVFKKEGKTIQATYFHDNGEIAQTGTYLKGKLHGEWIAYNNKGQKTAIANYEHGQKIGKWFFWNEGKLTEVDYTNNGIAKVVEWKEADPVVLRQRP